MHLLQRPESFHYFHQQNTGNDRYSGHGYSGIDRYSGTKNPDDAILFTVSGITAIVEQKFRKFLFFEAQSYKRPLLISRNKIYHNHFLFLGVKRTLHGFIMSSLLKPGVLIASKVANLSPLLNLVRFSDIFHLH